MQDLGYYIPNMKKRYRPKFRINKAILDPSLLLLDSTYENLMSIDYDVDFYFPKSLLSIKENPGALKFYKGRINEEKILSADEIIKKLKKSSILEYSKGEHKENISNDLIYIFSRLEDLGFEYKLVKRIFEDELAFLINETYLFSRLKKIFSILSNLVPLYDLRGYTPNRLQGTVNEIIESIGYVRYMAAIGMFSGFTSLDVPMFSGLTIFLFDV